MKVQQVQLERNTETGTQVLTCWLPTRTPPLTVGNKLRLKGESVWWDVSALFSIRDKDEIHDDWHAGGISS